MSKEKSQYLNITPDSIGRFIFDKSPSHLKGLCTTHQPSSIIVIFIGNEGISVVHSTGIIGTAALLNELEYIGEIRSWSIACHRSFYPHMQDNCEAFEFIEIIQNHVLNELPDKIRRYYFHPLQNQTLRVTREGIISDNNIPSECLIHADDLYRRRFVNFFNYYFDPQKTYADIQFDQGRREPCPPLTLSYDEMYLQATEDTADEQKEADARRLLAYLFFYIGRYKLRDQFSFLEAEGKRISIDRKLGPLLFFVAEEKKKEEETTFHVDSPPLSTHLSSTQGK